VELEADDAGVLQYVPGTLEGVMVVRMEGREAEAPGLESRKLVFHSLRRAVMPFLCE
jgi:hypothetical protein